MFIYSVSNWTVGCIYFVQVFMTAVFSFIKVSDLKYSYELWKYG